MEKDVSALIGKGDEKNIRTEIIYDDQISAPIAYREKLGTINCYLNDELISSGNLLSNQEVKRKNFINYLDELVGFGYRLGRQNV